MADLVSPGVQVKEKDLTASVRSEPTSIGAFAGSFNWGPMNEVVTVSDETQLVDIFGKPDAINYDWWFSAANFLAYANTLRVVRVENTGSKNAGVSGTPILIPNETSWQVGDGTHGPFSGGQATVGEWAARYAGNLGNSLKVSACWDAAGYYEANKTNVAISEAKGQTTITVAAGANLGVGDIIDFGDPASGANAQNQAVAAAEKGQKYKITNISSNDITIVRHPTVNATGLVSAVDGTTNPINVNRHWAFYDQFAGPPGTSAYVQAAQGGVTTGVDELHIIVCDEDGEITGTPNTILEKYEKVSKASDAVTASGDNNFYPDVLFRQSQYIYWMDYPAGGTDWGSAAAGAGPYATATGAGWATASLTGGAPATNVAPTNAQLANGYDYFKDPDTVDFNLLIAGPASTDGATSTVHAIDLIDMVDARKDSVVFLSPYKDAVVNVVNGYKQTDNVKVWADSLPSTSFAVIDSGYKKQYDKYNDVFRWVPLNGDIAGCCARTDAVEDPWWSPAGLNRGQIRGAVELALNPTQTERDILYRNRVNPVVTYPGEGTVLWGDKTALNQNSAFDRINVRRLFITIEEAIAVAARTVLFEFNDVFTREQFVGMVNPYLRDVTARRGITDFLVVCDETNNTGQVIDNNEFRADIYVKPARSINYITLTFVATRTDIAFSEVVGRA